MGNAFAWPDCKLKTRLEIEEGYCSVLKLRADNAVRLQAKAIAIEPERSLQIINADRD